MINLAAYRNQHYVPQAYLKAWTDLSEKLYLYNKDKSLIKYSKTENVLYTPHLYTKNAVDTLILTDEDIELIFGILRDYVIKLDGIVLSSIYECARHYDFFDEWEIFNKDGSLAKKKRIKHEIDQTKITTIEHRWDQIENSWLKLKERVEKSVTNRSGSITREDLNQIYNFIVAQKWRTPKSIQYYKEMIDPLIKILEEQFGDACKDVSHEYSEAYFKKSLMKYQDKKEKSHMIKELELVNECTVVFFITENDDHFYTSDNPVFIITDKDFYNGNYNGMYFPLSPKILCAIYKGDPEKYLILSMPSELTEVFNNTIVNNSVQYFISNMIIQ